MNKKELIQELGNMDSSLFQRLGDRILKYYNKEYEYLINKGNHLYKNKTVKGTPDSYKEVDGQIIAVQYTTIEKDLKNKMLEDLKKVTMWEQSKSVSKIVLVSNSRSKDEIIKACKQECEKINWKVDFVWLETLIEIIETNFDARVEAQDILKIDIDSIKKIEDFESYYKEIYKVFICEKILNSNNTLSISNEELLAVDIINSNNDKEITDSDLINQRLALIIGNGGTGKSVFMKNSFLRSLNSKGISIFIDLIKYNGESLSGIIKQNIECKGYSVSEVLIKELLNRGEFRLFLDGFDEIRDHNVNIFLNKCTSDSYLTNNIFYISSREIDNLKYLYGGFSKFYIRPLGKGTIFNILLKYTNSEYEKGILNDYLSESNFKVLSKPLYLGLLIRYLEKNNNLIEILSFESDYELLDYLMNNILSWNDKKVNNFIDEIKNMLPIVAFNVTKSYRLLITEKEFNEYIINGIKEMGLEIDLGDLSKLKKEILSYGFIEKYNDDLFKFEHKNFQDYFTAKYLINKDDLDVKDITSNALFEDSLLLIARHNLGYIEDRIHDFNVKILDKIYNQIDNTELTKSARRYIKKWFNNEYKKDLKVEKLIKHYYNSHGLKKLITQEIKKINDFSCWLNEENHFTRVFKIYSEQTAEYPLGLIKELLDLKKLGKPYIIFSIYSLAPVFSANFKFTHYKEYEQSFIDIENYFIELLNSNDEEILYNVLHCIKEYCREGIIEGFIITTYGNVDRIMSSVENVSKNISERVSAELNKISEVRNKQKPFTENIRLLSKRIANYKINSDKYLARDLISFSTIFIPFFNDEFGEGKIINILIDGLKLYTLDLEYKCEILRYLNKYDNEDVLNIVCDMLLISSSSAIHRSVREESLMCLCSKITPNKLNKLIEQLISTEDEETKLFILFGIWSTYSSYKDIEIGKVKILSSYLQTFKSSLQTIDVLECYIDGCVNLWNSSLLIKDSEFGINIFYKFEEFTSFILKEVDEELLDELFVYVLDEYGNVSKDEDGSETETKYDSKKENTSSILVWMIQKFSQGKIKWLKLLEKKDSDILKKNTKEINESIFDGNSSVTYK